MTPEELAAIEARANAATPGPWRRMEHSEVVDASDGTVIADVTEDIIGKRRLTNLDFIAAARTDIPRLIAEVRRLWDALDDALDDVYAVRGDLVVTFTQDEPYDSIWCNVRDNVQSWEIHGPKVIEFRDWLRGLDEWTRSTDVEIRAWLAENLEANDE